MFLRKCGIHGEGDQFCLQIEEFNRYDRYAVAIVVDKKLSDMCQTFLLHVLLKR